MRNNEEIMTAEEFFGELDQETNTSSRKSRPRGRRNSNDLFAAVKVKLVMRVYGVSRAKALEIISVRAAEQTQKKEEEVSRPRDESFMSAAEFFGEV